MKNKELQEILTYGMRLVLDYDDRVDPSTLRLPPQNDLWNAFSNQNFITFKGFDHCIHMNASYGQSCMSCKGKMMFMEASSSKCFHWSGRSYLKPMMNVGLPTELFEL